jgi:hypothetical protein
MVSDAPIFLFTEVTRRTESATQGVVVGLHGKKLRVMWPGEREEIMYVADLCRVQRPCDTSIAVDAHGR